MKRHSFLPLLASFALAISPILVTPAKKNIIKRGIASSEELEKCTECSVEEAQAQLDAINRKLEELIKTYNEQLALFETVNNLKYYQAFFTTPHEFYDQKYQEYTNVMHARAEIFAPLPNASFFNSGSWGDSQNTYISASTVDAEVALDPFYSRVNWFNPPEKLMSASSPSIHSFGF